MFDTASTCLSIRVHVVVHPKPNVCRRVLRGGLALGRWNCDLQVAGSIPTGQLSRNIGQLSLASLRGG